MLCATPYCRKITLISQRGRISLARARDKREHFQLSLEVRCFPIVRLCGTWPCQQATNQQPGAPGFEGIGTIHLIVNSRAYVCMMIVFCKLGALFSWLNPPGHFSFFWCALCAFHSDCHMVSIKLRKRVTKCENEAALFFLFKLQRLSCGI